MAPRGYGSRSLKARGFRGGGLWTQASPSGHTSLETVGNVPSRKAWRGGGDGWGSARNPSLPAGAQHSAQDRRATPASRAQDRRPSSAAHQDRGRAAGVWEKPRFSGGFPQRSWGFAEGRAGCPGREPTPQSTLGSGRAELDLPRCALLHGPEEHKGNPAVGAGPLGAARPHPFRVGPSSPKGLYVFSTKGKTGHLGLLATKYLIL